MTDKKKRQLKQGPERSEGRVPLAAGKTVLVVAAHPDDEVLGCGGTIARLARKGLKVSTLILIKAITSRAGGNEKAVKSEDIKDLKRSIDKAAKVLGVKKTFLFNFPDNKFDSVPLIDIVKVIEKVKAEIKPDVVYTHHRGDLNIDHRITFNAVLTACRPLAGETVREIYSFETPSSTEWNYPYKFNPNIFVDITGEIEKKIEALKCYASELREFPHPRSEESIRCIAKHRGSTAGLSYAEAFEAVRIIR